MHYLPQRSRQSVYTTKPKYHIAQVSPALIPVFKRQKVFEHIEHIDVRNARLDVDLLVLLLAFIKCATSEKLDVCSSTSQMWLTPFLTASYSWCLPLRPSIL